MKGFREHKDLSLKLIALIKCLIQNISCKAILRMYVQDYFQMNIIKEMPIKKGKIISS